MLGWSLIWVVVVRSLNDQLHQQTMSFFLIYLCYQYCNFPPKSPAAVKIVWVEGRGLDSVLIWLEAVPGIRNSLIPPPLHLPGLCLFGDSGKDQSRSYKGLNLPISQPHAHRYKKGLKKTNYNEAWEVMETKGCDFYKVHIEKSSIHSHGNLRMDKVQTQLWCMWWWNCRMIT